MNHIKSFNNFITESSKTGLNVQITDAVRNIYVKDFKSKFAEKMDAKTYINSFLLFVKNTIALHFTRYANEVKVLMLNLFLKDINDRFNYKFDNDEIHLLIQNLHLLPSDSLIELAFYKNIDDPESLTHEIIDLLIHDVKYRQNILQDANEIYNFYFSLLYKFNKEGIINHEDYFNTILLSGLRNSGRINVYKVKNTEKINVSDIGDDFVLVLPTYKIPGNEKTVFEILDLTENFNSNFVRDKRNNVPYYYLEIDFDMFKLFLDNNCFYNTITLFNPKDDHHPNKINSIDNSKLIAVFGQWDRTKKGVI